MRILATLILCLGLFASSFASDPKVTNTQHALDRLIAHPDREDRFVIVDHLSSEKFVQFDFEDDEVVVDLPILALIGAEQERAAALVASVGVERPSVVTEASETEEAPTFATYRLGFGKNSARATAFAARVFKEVYLLPPDARFVVTEGE